MSDYANLQVLAVELHALLCAGKGDSAEADQVRDAMDGPWWRMTPAERETYDALLDANTSPAQNDR